MPPKQPVKKGAAVTKKPSGGTASKPAASKSGAGKTAAANNLRDLRIAVGGSHHSGTCLYA